MVENTNQIWNFRSVYVNTMENMESPRHSQMGICQCPLEVQPGDGKSRAILISNNLIWHCKQRPCNRFYRYFPVKHRDVPFPCLISGGWTEQMANALCIDAMIYAIASKVRMEAYRTSKMPLSTGKWFAVTICWSLQVFMRRRRTH